MKQSKFPGIFENKVGKRLELCTKNLAPGKTVYSENLVIEGNEEFRSWDPKRSKLCAAILKGLNQLGFKPGDMVLYLGASTGTTVSHVSDIVGRGGLVFAVEFAPRVARELVFVADARKNVAPILADANQFESYAHKILQVDFIYQDIAQRNQAEIFLKNRVYLKPGGFGMLCVKSRSIDITKKPKEVFKDVRKKLEAEVEVVDSRFLEPFQKDHCLFLCKKK
ncbi:fibrillarin-like rRNA/tRNA 2'-O-methyltransferase [Candidatus Woesearchaeota archaeon]|nr:fibrillarin-like rRNA/tRNA 2'-O-methyltransferase [Candidatus Woesearchaeota archaeon]